MTQGLMLAKRGTEEDIDQLQTRGWIFDLKIDGVRCLATIDRGKVTLIGRSGVDMTPRYPEVVRSLINICPTGRLVLDGEIAVKDERGLPSWPLTHKRDAQQRGASRWAIALPATFYAFDLLEIGTEDLRSSPLGERRARLDEEAQKWAIFYSPTPSLVVSSTDGHTMWENLVVEHGLEGLVAKNPAKAYRKGRNGDWVKIKRTHTVSCLVGGFDPGEGSRASTFGALHLYLLNEDQALVPVGRVGSGFSDRELRQVMQALVDPPAIVEVTYLDVTPEGVLRQPVFQRLRTDQVLSDCTIDQIA